MNWENARDFCKSTNGILAVLNTKELNHFARRNYGTERSKIWIGGAFSSNLNGWRWVSGENIGEDGNFQSIFVKLYVVDNYIFSHVHLTL